MSTPVTTVLAEAATPADLLAARTQMALSLGWHIVLACFGVGMPAIAVFAEWRGNRTGDGTYLLLAQRWAKASPCDVGNGDCVRRRRLAAVPLGKRSRRRS